MRYLIITIMVLSLSITAYADDYTLLGKEIHHGGYGAPVLKVTSIGGNSEAFVGLKGGWIIDHSFVIGVAGYSMVSDRYFEDEDIIWPDRQFYDPLNIEYGGLYFEYIINRKHPVHFSVDLLIGSGRIYHDYGDHFWGGDLWRDEYEDHFLVVEPGANMMLKVAEFLRIGVGVSYRDVQEVQFLDYDEDDLSDASLNFCLKFGKF